MILLYDTILLSRMDSVHCWSSKKEIFLNVSFYFVIIVIIIIFLIPLASIAGLYLCDAAYSAYSGNNLSPKMAKSYCI